MTLLFNIILLRKDKVQGLRLDYEARNGIISNLHIKVLLLCMCIYKIL